MSIFIKIINKSLTETDISTICSVEKGVEKHVLVKDCWIEDLDISTTNPNVIASGCYFANSGFVAPSKALSQAEDNIFHGNYLRNPVRSVVKCVGYYNPVIA